MSLPEAVLQIADEIGNDALDARLTHGDLVLRMETHAKLLRMAVKASEGNQIKAVVPGVGSTPSKLNDVIFENLESNKAQRLAVKKVEQELAHRVQAQEGGARMALLMGGLGDGTMVLVPGQMPLWAKTRIGGTVYELRTDGALHSIPESTESVVETKRIVT